MARPAERVINDHSAAPPRHLGLRLVSAFVVGFVGLSLEIAYTRVISFKIFIQASVTLCGECTSAT